MRSSAVALKAAILVVLLAMSCTESQMTSVEASVEEAVDIVSVPLCLGCNIFAEAPSQAGGKSVMDIGYLRNAAAAAMAVRDINNLNCTIYGPGCEDIVSWEGDVAREYF
jgi:hypothetical protein